VQTNDRLIPVLSYSHDAPVMPVLPPADMGASAAQTCFWAGLALFMPLASGLLALCAGTDALREFGTLSPRDRRRTFIGMTLGTLNVGAVVVCFIFTFTDRH